MYGWTLMILSGRGRWRVLGAAYQKAVWIFRGSKDRRIFKEPVFVDASGMDIAAGVGVDFWGQWHKRCSFVSESFGRAGGF